MESTQLNGLASDSTQPEDKGRLPEHVVKHLQEAGILPVVQESQNSQKTVVLDVRSDNPTPVGNKATSLKLGNNIVERDAVYYPHANLTISHIPNQPPLYVTQDDMYIAQNDRWSVATPQELRSASKLLLADSPTKIVHDSKDVSLGINVSHIPIRVPNIHPCLLSNKVVRMKNDYIEPNYDIERWPCYNKEDGTLLCDKYANIDDIDLTLD